MKELYNCKKIDKEHYRITKFDKHLDPKWDTMGHQSSYITSEVSCDCPQGHQPSCRHRKMLPFFIDHEYVDTEYFFVWDTHQWYKAPAPVAEAGRANGKNEPAKPHNQVIEEPLVTPDIEPEGGTLPVSAAPSPQPSPKPAYRRF